MQVLVSKFACTSAKQIQKTPLVQAFLFNLALAMLLVSMILEERKTTIKQRPIRFSEVNLPCNRPYAHLTTSKRSYDW